MSLRRGCTLLAIVAALFGAPSAVLGAPPNTLTVPVVAPTAGTTATPFVLSVTYLSTAGNAATSVSAAVAGRTVILSRVAGTPVSGTWSAATTLPAGSWTVTFSAMTAKGPKPSLGGGTIVVAALAPPPSPPRSSSPSPAMGEEPGAGGHEPTPAPLPIEDPTEPAGSGVVAGSAAPSQTTPPLAPSTTSPAAGGPTSSGGVTAPAAGPDTPAGAPPAPAASQPPAGGSPAEPGVSPAAEGGTAAIGVIEADADLVWRILLGGLMAVAAVAVAGMAWLVAGRRRDPEPEAAGAATLPAERPLRGRRGRPITTTEDPVIAAMGLDRPGKGRPRASQVHHGPGERDASAPPHRRR